jgi:lactate 2-monooxygenase
MAMKFWWSLSILGPWHGKHASPQAPPVIADHHRRPADLDNAYVPFIKGVGNQVGFSDPVFRKKFEQESGSKVEEDITGASRAWVSEVFSGKPHTWEQLSLLRKHWDGPIVLKGIQHVEDAKLALKHGCDGIVVSNHGGRSLIPISPCVPFASLTKYAIVGRQVDGAIGSLEVLPEIIDAVGSEMTVLFDSGIRTGADIVKALSLGAKAVLVSRPVIYGLAIDGKNGAKSTLQGMLADFYQTMALAGIGTIANCTRDMVRRVQYGGDLKAMM